VNIPSEKQKSFKSFFQQQHEAFMRFKLGPEEHLSIKREA